MDNLNKAICVINQSIRKKQLSVRLERSRLVLSIVDCLEKANYIRGYNLFSNSIEILFIYRGDIPLFREITRISKSTRRQFVSKKWFYNKFDKSKSYVVSSSKGIFLYSRLFSDITPQMGGEILLELS
jgi:ribosomal protein S8